MIITNVQWDDMKHGVDIIAAGVTAGAVLHALPDVTTIFTFLWVCIRIYETNTVKAFIGRETGIIKKLFGRK